MMAKVGKKEKGSGRKNEFHILVFDMINTLSRDVRGLGDPEKSCVKEVCRSWKMSILTVQETKVKRLRLTEAKDICAHKN